MVQFLNNNFLQTNIELFGSEIFRLIIQICLYDQSIFKNYISYLWNFDFGNNKLRQLLGEYNILLPSILLYFFIIFFIQLILLKFNKINNKIDFKIIVCANMGFVIYLLFTYLHELNIQQPVLIDNQLNILGDASFSGSTRYIRVYLLSLTLLSLYLLFEIIKLKKKFNIIFFSSIFALLFSIVFK